MLTIALASGAVSCSKQTPDVTVSGELELMPCSTSTKAAVQDGSLPDDYTIYLSAFFNNLTSERASDNYLTAEPFRKGASSWSASPAVYWPMGGYLDFLALAAKDIDVRSRAQWYAENVSRSVALDVPDGCCLDSEILYSKASSKKDSGRCVQMNFSHAQSWVSFEFAHHEDNTVRIDSIVVCKPYLGGTLRIENGVFLSCQWDFHGHFRQDYVIPGTRGIVLNAETKVIDLLLPEQDACSFLVYYTQKDPSEPSWDNYTRRDCFTAQAIADPWHAGTKTVYTMVILKQVSLTVSVHDWANEDKPINIR